MVRLLARVRPPVLLLCLGVGDMPSHQEEGDILIRRFKGYHPHLLVRAEAFGDFVREVTGSALADGVELLVFRDPWGGAPAILAAPECAAVFEVNALPSWELGYTYPLFRGNHALRAKLEDQELFCLRESDLALTVSAATGRALAGIGVPRGKILVAPNAAGAEFFSAAEIPSPVPELAGGDWIGYVGSLHGWQGVETALDAFALTAPDFPAARLLLLSHARRDGRRALLRRVRKAGLAGRVVLREPLPPAGLAAALRRLRFTVAPLADTSRNTGQGCCPLKIVESMAAGVPVLASDLEVNRALVRHGEDGLLAPAGDPRAWSLAMRRLLADHALTARLGAEARKIARRRFTEAALARRVVPSLEAAAEGRRLDRAG
jgi:glycosyltransferase involved in cell wall biosynthesis